MMKTLKGTDEDRGQAILELAVFGSIIIMLLGILINYGLRYNNQAQAMQKAFRQGLRYASETVDDGKPASVSYLIVEDKHIPSPSDPFGVGPVIPVSASASITRNYAMHKTADKIEELPRLAIDVRGGKCPGSRFSPEGSEPPCYYLTAGFREEKDVNENDIEKYAEIYGQEPQVCTGLGAGGECVSWMVAPDQLDYGDGVLKNCAVLGEPNPETGVPSCLEWTIDKVRIIDSCAGEVIDYSAAVKQCRQIVDEEVCKKECERAKVSGSDADCNSICAGKVNAPNQSNKGYDPAQGGAWYCAKYTEDDPAHHKYTFPVLERLAGRHKVMGLQPDYTKQTDINNNVLTRDENSFGITTTDTLDWSDTTTREIIHRDYDDETGAVKGDKPEDAVVSTVGQTEKKEFSGQPVSW